MQSEFPVAVITFKMKHKVFIFGRIYILILLLFYFEYEVVSQNNRPERWKQPGIFFGAGGGLAYTQILNKGTQSVSNKLQNRKNSFAGSIEVGYFFSKDLGLITGLNYYSSVTSYCNLESYQNQYNTFDSENDPYELRVTGSDIGETQKIDILSIPVCLNFRKPLTASLGFSMQSGINFFVPLNNRYQSGGVFTYKGYFPAYNVLLEDLPEYGFPSNLSVVSNGKVELKPISLGAVVSAGFDYLIQKRVQLILAGCFDRTLTSVSNYSSPDELLSSETGQMNNTMSGSNETKVQTISIKLSIRYFLTDFTKFKYYFHPSPKENLQEYERRQNMFRY